MGFPAAHSLSANSASHTTRAILLVLRQHITIHEVWPTTKKQQSCFTATKALFASCWGMLAYHSKRDYNRVIKQAEPWSTKASGQTSFEASWSLCLQKCWRPERVGSKWSVTKVLSFSVTFRMYQFSLLMHSSDPKQAKTWFSLRFAPIVLQWRLMLLTTIESSPTLPDFVM